MIKLGLLLSLILMPNAVAYKTEKICEKKMTKKGEVEECRRVVVREDKKSDKK